MSSRQAGRIRSTASRLRTHTFSALVDHPNYRLYWLGALASNVGTWTQMVAQGWLVYDLTGSTFYLGLVGFATAIPSLFLSLVGGVLADRFERRRLMVYTQAGAMTTAFLLAYLAISGQVTVWHILAIAFVAGIVNALNVPIRQTIISDLVPRDALLNAVALNSAQFQASRTLGPAVAGLIVAAVGPGWCFFINGLSFLAVIGALLAMKLPPLAPVQRKTSMRMNLAEGIRYVRRDPIILSLVGLATVPSFFGMPYNQVMPAFASSVLHVGAEGLGFLMSCAGLGALIGALGVASLGRGAPRGMLLLAAIIAFGTALAIFAGSQLFGLSALMLVVVGTASMSYNALNQTFLQTLSEDAMRGRVMSILTVATFGLQPLGTLLVGSAASLVGPQAAVVAGGSVCAVFALWMM
ncbi:MAG: MFS transporter, partial [Dehalococcoidales bacterium]|nr:MFS transporter [Dehalococcoidales bacterium]